MRWFRFLRIWNGVKSVKKHNQTMRALMKPNQEKKVNFLSVKTQFQNDKYTSLPNDNNLYVILTGTYCIAKPLAFTDVNLLVQYYNILADGWNRKKNSRQEESQLHIEWYGKTVSRHTHTHGKRENEEIKNHHHETPSKNDCLRRILL